MLHTQPFVAILNNRPPVYTPIINVAPIWYYIIISLWLLMVLIQMPCIFLLKLFLQQAIAIAILILGSIFIGATEILFHRVLLGSVVLLYAMAWMFNPPECYR